MFVPIVPTEPMTEEDGTRTKPWDNYFQQSQQNQQECLSDEGFVIPSQTNADMLIIQNGKDKFGNQIARPGTLIFNTSIVNGGSSGAPNGQLYILLQDGIFHPITNT